MIKKLLSIFKKRFVKFNSKNTTIEIDKNTMYVIIKRYYSDELQTFSNIYINDMFVCFGCENTSTLVKQGVYPTILNTVCGFNSRDTYKDLNGMINPLIPDRTNILVHIGNYYSDSTGCLLLGNGVDTSNINRDNKIGSITYSKDAYMDRFYPIVSKALIESKEVKFVYIDNKALKIKYKGL